MRQTREVIRILSEKEVDGGFKVVSSNGYREKWRAYKIGYGFLLLYALAAHISTAVASVAMAGGIVTIGVIWFENKERPELTKQQLILMKALFIFVFLVAITDLFSYKPKESLVATIGMAIRFSPMVMAIFFLRTKKQLQRVIVVLFISLFIADIAALRQLLHHEQTIGLVHNRIYFANQLLPMLILAIVCVLYKMGTVMTRCWIGSAALLTAGILLFSQVRGVWLAGIVVYGAFLVLYRKRSSRLIAFSAGIALLVVVCFVLNPELSERWKSIADMASESNIERIYMWESAWAMFLEKPLVGLGVGQFQHFYTPEYHYLMPLSKNPGFAHPHNVVMTFLAETGLIGVAGFFLFFATVLLLTAMRYRGEKDGLALIAFLATIGFLFAGMTDNVFAMVTVFRVMTLLIGIGVAHVRLNTEPTNVATK